MTRLIDRNTKIPTQGKKVFTTASDGQTQVNVKVYQGESDRSSDNSFLADFTLKGIPRAPRGVPQVEVVFDIDVNGIVHVTASDLRSGQRQQIQASSVTGLTRDEIERLSRSVQHR